MRKLDKSKPYCIISGQHVAVFEQDGVCFMADGSEAVVERVNALTPEQIAEQKAIADEAAAQVSAKQKADEDAALAAQKEADDKAKADAEASAKAGDVSPPKNKGGRPPKNPAQSAIDAQIAAQGGQ